jgi:hypothetical protein
MTSSIGLFGLAANLVILGVLVGALTRPGAPQLARLLIATVAFVCAWLLAAVFEALRAPGWTMLVGAAVIVFSIFVIVVNLHLWARGADSGETGPGRRDDHGGGGPRRPRPGPQDGGGDSDPSWWPEFERRLAFYVAERERQNREPTVLLPQPATIVRSLAREAF